MKNLLKTNIRIILALIMAIGLSPISFFYKNEIFDFVLLVEKPILSAFLALTSILFALKMISYYTKKQKLGLSIFFLLLPFSFYFENQAFDFILIKFQPAIAIAYFGVGLGLLFNTIKTKQLPTTYM